MKTSSASRLAERENELLARLPPFHATAPGAATREPTIPLTLQFLRQEDDRNVHANDRYILVYVFTGKKNFYINDRAHSLKAGEALLIPPLARHRFLPSEAAVLLAAFRIGVPDSRLEALGESVFRPQPDERRRILRAQEAFLKWFNGETSAGADAACHFALALNLILKRRQPMPDDFERRTYTKHGDAKLTRILEILRHNLHRRVTLAELSAELNMSISSLQNLFKAQMRQSLGHYALTLRLRHAEILLRSTDMTISEIALTTGFESDVTLRRALRRETGLSPAATREKMRS